jgi:hypothetical protein
MTTVTLTEAETGETMTFCPPAGIEEIRIELDADRPFSLVFSDDNHTLVLRPR